ncbi:TetR/AcrR family transcriptional regulator [Riemerella anatipestifer]|uniref:TetR/AcrR family transcriptional regulator n=1 Tax=Riemerella anatipestifer TaxID=34085 RepID=A0AAP6HFW8_RIEAN|nr:TetR/AcrR family transcriptional regulator [Riemerella anatipestifer]MBT0555951.1 TetR/AcrR family transcriptional regulator [Riemerella anatipestifer]MCD5968662.1 TetR/AcrR family transcriptional regulator [Riemerella anatipestifer]MCO7355115.1 TetR/AcrR family transcriptional regulator [Riemerella anatipestifer]MCU7540805.1 TetR/AcrR family transcriptional regulator [Riemerella anatipestifer]MCU7570599.1 TetR/AcrR family transcriptional regulator [Riemerella anatipestifer]
MEDRIIFLKKVSELFVQNGAKSLTMDDIAKAFSISKKTLYQNYKNKEVLLEEVLDFLLKQLLEQLKAEEEKSLNPIEKMLLRETKIEQISENNRTVFVRQLIKYYPEIYNMHIVNVYKGIYEILKHNVIKGREQGLYEKDFDIETYAKYFLELMFAFDSSPLFEEEQKIGRSNYCQGVVRFYLNAIVTPKGKEFLNQLTYNNEK